MFWYLDTLISGYLHIQSYIQSLYLDIFISGYLDVWISWFLDILISEYLDIWISGYLDIWISGYLDIWISWYLDILIFGYLDIWIFWYLDTWISWYLDIQYSILSKYSRARNYNDKSFIYRFVRNAQTSRSGIWQKWLSEDGEDEESMFSVLAAMLVRKQSRPEITEL